MITQRPQRKAVVMLSGGLDSTLAAKLVMEQGVELFAINFLTAFCTCTKKNSSCLASQKTAGQLGIPLKVVNVSKEYLAIVKNPKYGYGRNMNPCIDCRIFTFKKAKDYMEEIGASFIVTGEVLGERPMSQRLEAMKIIEKEAGLQGLVVRPLSAKLLEPSLPEKEGWLERDKFLGFRGKDRNPQMELAENLGISDYPCPAGGCLLTYEGFANKVRDLVKHDRLDMEHVRLLKVGRHFRISRDVKLIVGKDEGENERLESMAGEEDILLGAVDVPGPLGIFAGKCANGELDTAASIVARYADIKGTVEVAYWRRGAAEKARVRVLPFSDEQVEKYRI